MTARIIIRSLLFHPGKFPVHIFIKNKLPGNIRSHRVIPDQHRELHINRHNYRPLVTQTSFLFESIYSNRIILKNKIARQLED
jgi:hypothetical protein